MFNSIGFEAIIIFVLILANAFFAASEIAIVSARRSRLQQQSDAGQKAAKQALDLAENPDRFLSTVQAGITLISTLAAAFGGASLCEPIAAWISTFPVLQPYAHTLALALVVILITYFTLVLGELVPKRLALQFSERIATFSAPFMIKMAYALGPAIAMLSASTNFVLRILGQGKATKNIVTEEDIVYLAREGIASGTVETEEEEFINRVFRFSDRAVNAVMKPRTEIVAIETDTPMQEVLNTFLNSGYTRLPLYEDSLDNIIGVLYAKDLLQARDAEQPVDLKAIARPPFYILEYQHVDDLLTTFRRKGTHMAIVIDEYSQVVGLVTLEDVLEELVGEIRDEYDEPQDVAFVQREDGSWLVDAMVDQEMAREKIGLPQAPEGERGRYHTLAGFVLTHTGHIPKVGETVAIGDFIIEIVDMDGRRIDKVLIRHK